MTAFDESPKIVEIDTFKSRSRSRSRWIKVEVSECGEELPYQAISSPLPCPTPATISIPECRNYQDSKSICGDAYLKPYTTFPNYMANTQSFKATLRSHNAPKQRPDPGSKKRLSLSEIMASSNSRMQRSCTQVDEDLVIKEVI
ncbi:hypothetical protein OIU77_027731 [Salix suchowensis]|uniref:DUF4005 domain-containing protein n=1 Tax=Salix suchowensis TaxID=1278906 RepID=A0ABQ9BTI2_9ROSI|nr:hypothetical protein OIU77_027731 [Salix suchowensis]